MISLAQWLNGCDVFLCSFKTGKVKRSIYADAPRVVSSFVAVRGNDLYYSTYSNAKTRLDSIKGVYHG